MTPFLHRIFDNPRWERNRMERAERIEIAEAKREAISATREGFSITKPGRWKVTKQNGLAVLQVFGETK